MRRGRGILRCAAALLVAVGASAAATDSMAAAAAGPAAGTGAGGLLLGRSDLGGGWAISAPAPRRVAPIACGRLHLRLSGSAARPASAASPVYAQSSSGPFVSETAYRYATATQAGQVWRGVARRGLLACLAQAVVSGSTRSVRFRVARESVLRAPRLGDASAVAFRIAAAAAQGGQSFNVFQDTVLVRAGVAVADLSVSSLFAPPSGALELRLARRVAARLARAAL